MKKSIFLIVLTGLLFATDFKEGQLVFSGQIRQRYEMLDKDFVKSTGSINNNYLRTRFNVSYTTGDVSTYVQFQDSRVFGSEANTLTDGSADAMDLHQAYFKINNLFTLPLSVKVGRFEAVYGPERLLGAVGWSNIGRSFDGVVFNYTNKIINVDILNLKQVELGQVDDEGDFNVRGAYAGLNLFKGQETQAFFIQNGDKNSYRNTIGAYGKGGFNNFKYEVEFALQNGTESKDVDYGAMMYALNAGYSFGGFNVSAGLDYISGDDTSTTDVNEMFSTLYATNHKYYGYMDYFTNLPVNTGNLGLMDIHVKASLKPIAGIKPMAAYHIFKSDQADVNGNTDFGNELDITLKHKYNDSVTIVGGYSLFTPGALKADDGSNSSFIYLMTIVNF